MKSLLYEESQGVAPMMYNIAVTPLMLRSELELPHEVCYAVSSPPHAGFLPTQPLTGILMWAALALHINLELLETRYFIVVLPMNTQVPSLEGS